MQDIAGWIAPAATMIAAMMTAANVGAKVTGWGFVVFTIGSIAWSVVGLTSGQMNLLASNGFLTLVNLVGIWRWLGRQAAYEEGARSAQSASRKAKTPALFNATGISGMAVFDEGGRPVGRAVEALLECSTGAVSYVVVATGTLAGVDEQLRAVPSANLSFGCDALTLRMAGDAFQGMATLPTGEWPASAERPSLANA